MTLQITSLRDIPQAIFKEFSNLEIPEQQAVFEQHSTTMVSIATAKEGGENGPFTLVFLEHNHGNTGRFERTEFLVCGYPAKTEEFAPGYEGFSPRHVMKIRFATDDPPYGSRTMYNHQWEQGKGFWVNEYLGIQFLEGYNVYSEMISRYGDWEFGFLLKLQQFAYELAKNIPIRGHWQSEWFPEGDYSKKPAGVY